MMKRKTILPLLLVLVLTGCSTQPDSSTPATGLETEPVTMALQTEELTEAPATAADPAAAAYAFLRDELVPQYGLASQATFDFYVCLSNGGTPTLPEEAQGIVSALVQDMNGDGVPELMTVRTEQTSMTIDFYRIGDDSCTLLASRTVPTLAPYIYVQDGQLFVQQLLAHSETANSAEFTALRLTDTGIEETLHILYSYSPDGESLTVNGEEVSGAPDSLDKAETEQRVQAALEQAGIRWRALWYVKGKELDYDCAFNFLNILLPDSDELLTFYSFDSAQVSSLADHTRLRERLSGSVALDAPLYEPTTAPTDAPAESIEYTAPAVETAAAAYVEDVLIPQYGLSDQAAYPDVDWDNTNTAQMPPKSTQGIISAGVEQFGSADVLVTVRSEDWSLILDLYEPDGDSFRQTDSYTVYTYDSAWTPTPEIRRQGDLIVCSYTWMYVPGCSHYGNSYVFLRVKDGRAEPVCELGSGRHPGTEVFTANGQEIAVIEGEMDYAETERLACEALDAAGVRYQSLSNGWGSERSDLLYGLQFELPDCRTLLKMLTTDDGESIFMDGCNITGSFRKGESE